MLVSVVSWAFVWHYISHNFHQGMEIFGIKHTPRKLQVEEDDIRRWKFSNTRTSLIHSIVSGLWCCFIISTNTDLFWDLNLFDARVQTMACCSFGYFIYDSFSMIKHNGLIQSYDIMLHHLIVFGNLYYLVHNKALIGGVVVGLANEMANITLNIRMVMKMSGRNPGNSSSYRKFRWVNLAGYCGLRILFHGRLTQYVHSVLDDDSIPYVTLPVAVFLNILNLMITIFSYRLVKTDFLGGWKKRGGEMSIDIDTSKSKQFID
jgi:hypothetical protein